MSRGAIQRWLAETLLAIVAISFVVCPRFAWGQQEELTRKVKSKVQPTYPAIARRMSITGTVKVQVVVAANGTVKTTKLVGGHPLLANAAIDAVKKWRFEAASEETTGVVEFKFDSQQ